MSGSEGSAGAPGVEELMQARAGERPAFLRDLADDKLVDALLRLAMELCVLRDRMDAYEAVLDEGEPGLRQRVENFTAPAELEAERMARRRRLVRRLLRDLS